MPDVVYSITIEKKGESQNTSELLENKGEQKDSIAKTGTTLLLAKQTGQNIISFVSSRVETYTGDSGLQNRVNFGLKTAAYAAGFAVNPALTALALTTEIVTSWADAAYRYKWEMIGINDNVSLLGGLSYGRNRSK